MLYKYTANIYMCTYIYIYIYICKREVGRWYIYVVYICYIYATYTQCKRLYILYICVLVLRDGCVLILGAEAGRLLYAALSY